MGILASKTASKNETTVKYFVIDMLIMFLQCCFEAIHMYDDHVSFQITRHCCCYEKSHFDLYLNISIFNICMCVYLYLTFFKRMSRFTTHSKKTIFHYKIVRSHANWFIPVGYLSVETNSEYKSYNRYIFEL